MINMIYTLLIKKKAREKNNIYLVMLWNDIVEIFVVWQRLLSDWTSIHIVTVGNGSLSIGLTSQHARKK